MKSFGACLLLLFAPCYLIAAAAAATRGSTQEGNVQQFGDAIASNLPLYCRGALYAGGDALTLAKTQFADLPQSAKARSRTVVSPDGKRGNQFKNFMMGREAAKDAGKQVQRGSYIPVRSNGKRDGIPIYGIYMGSSDMDVIQKWLSSYHLQ